MINWLLSQIAVAERPGLAGFAQLSSYTDHIIPYDFGKLVRKGLLETKEG